MRLVSIPAFLLVLASTWLTSDAVAQIRFGDLGFVAAGVNGSAGDACWGFDCSPRPLAVQSGETLSLRVAAPLGAPFAIFASPGFGSCLQLPGIYNAFNLDPSFLVPLFVGLVDQPNLALFCYDGFVIRMLPLPLVPAGTTMSLQAVAAVGTPISPCCGLAMSSVVQLTVR